ncbi:hypothetical protein HQ489_00885 [Candidatus Woesearchaeota archaeon]|nr:hypothetical protein [Candidatus Woesearchaeota archaeon]
MKQDPYNLQPEIKIESKPLNVNGIYMGAPSLLPETWQPGGHGKFTTQRGIFMFDFDKGDFDSLELKLSVKGNPIPIRSISGSYKRISSDGNNFHYKEIAPLSALYTRLVNYWKK